MINFREYQDLSSRTINYNLNKEEMLANFGMGLAGESGETVEILKKHLFHKHDLDIDEIRKELGDVLWYISAICNTLNLSMGRIAFENVMKLKKRYPDKFGYEESINRID